MIITIQTNTETQTDKKDSIFSLHSASTTQTACAWNSMFTKAVCISNNI